MLQLCELSRKLAHEILVTDTGKQQATNVEVIDFFSPWLIFSHPWLCLTAAANPPCGTGSEVWLDSFERLLISAERSLSPVSEAAGLQG